MTFHNLSKTISQRLSITQLNLSRQCTQILPSISMKFIADENLGVRVPQYLKNLGFDIIWVKEIAPGKADIQILEIANKEKRVLITQDKDFGELVFKEKLANAGVILLRLKDESVKNKKEVLLHLLSSKKDFYGKFTVVKDKKVEVIYHRNHIQKNSQPPNPE